ncbi:phage holin family protein [Methylosinus sp. Sm6]|uniref:phage holin family protein n=1 Tax=Methylosinus sp. Sm6 TaxID=2866948 RepID=UPI001C98E4F6|nr:phage holin family protein [Methylosinus sp. Sm6]MBY6241958.1 hypothetical protein [Methylosinus sp. Sm6]
MPPLVESARHAIEMRAKRLGLGVALDAAAILSAAVALFFFTYGAFVLADRQFGTVVASLLLGAFYLALAAALYVWSRRLAQQPVGAPRSDDTGKLLLAATAGGGRPDWLVAPVVIAAGIEILRRVGARRLIPAFALSAVAVAAAQTTMRSRPGSSEKTNEQQQEKKHA